MEALVKTFCDFLMNFYMVEHFLAKSTYIVWNKWETLLHGLFL